jgi:hypothetical protein
MTAKAKAPAPAKSTAKLFMHGRSARTGFWRGPAAPFRAPRKFSFSQPPEISRSAEIIAPPHDPQFASPLPFRLYAPSHPLTPARFGE